jgi:hypothetical protein
LFHHSAAPHRHWSNQSHPKDIGHVFQQEVAGMPVINQVTGNTLVSQGGLKRNQIDMAVCGQLFKNTGARLDFLPQNVFCDTQS